MRFAHSELSQAVFELYNTIERVGRGWVLCRWESIIFVRNFIAHFLHSTARRCINLNLNKKKKPRGKEEKTFISVFYFEFEKL